MSHFIKTELSLDHRFDTATKRHYLNDALSVLHCHHFTTLYTQLAMDANETGLLTDVAEESMYEILTRYFEDHGIEELKDRIDIGQQYYAALGMGSLAIDFLGEFSGGATLVRSHVDEGWIAKWGKYDRPVNYITAGYCAALFAAVLDKPTGSFKANEIESIVMGAKKSVFTVVRK